MKIHSVVCWLSIASFTASFGLVACGESSGESESAEEDADALDNVGACKEWVAAVDCGTFDAEGTIPCDSFGNLTCDIGDYFDCLADNFTCTDGHADTAQWSKCIDYASCD